MLKFDIIFVEICRTEGKTLEKVLALVSCLATICVIIIGQIYWEGKIKSHAEAAHTMTEESAPTIDKVEEIDEFSFNQLPQELVEKAKLAKQTGEKLKFVIYGSEATSTEEGAWPHILKAELEENYVDIFDVLIYSDEDKTTYDVIDEKLYEKVVDEQPDVFLFEPFILKDNGLGIAQTLENISFILEEIKSKHPDVTIYIQPAHPIYNAIYYPREVDELGQFSEENGYIYLNHWSSWPEQDNEQILDFLTEGQNKPNEDGNKVWAEFLINYFVK